MTDIEITLLSENDVSEGTMLDVLKKYGLEAESTDLSQLTGITHKKDRIDTYGRKVALYFTKTFHDSKKVGLSGVAGIIWSRISECAVLTGFKTNSRVGIRPVLKLSSEKYDEIINSQSFREDNVPKVEFGEYPQWVPDKQVQKQLEHDLRSGSLIETGNVYTFDDCNHNIDIDYDHYPLDPITYKEYYNHKGRKFIRIKANYQGNELPYFKNKTTCKNDEYIWVEVTPITWLVDKKTKSLVSENTLVSGIIFQGYGDLTKFEETEIYKYITKYMLKEILQQVKVDYAKNIELPIDKIDEYEDKLLRDESLSKEEIELLKNAIKLVRDDSKIKKR